MLQDVVSVSLPVNERMRIKKNHFEPYNLTGKEKRICIVTGIHGDELEGQYVCYELIRRLGENGHLLNGIVDIYPSMNPLGMDSIKREMPIFDLDMNMIFPGSETGAVAEHIAAAIMNDIKGADICIDIHASNIFLREMLMYGREAQSKTRIASPATIPKSGERNRKIHSCMLYLISI